MVIPYFFDATIKWVCSSASAMGLKTIDTSLLILRMEQPFSATNALFKSFFSPTETRILNGHGYMYVDGIYPTAGLSYALRATYFFI